MASGLGACSTSCRFCFLVFHRPCVNGKENWSLGPHTASLWWSNTHAAAMWLRLGQSECSFPLATVFGPPWACDIFRIYRIKCDACGDYWEHLSFLLLDLNLKGCWAGSAVWPSYPWTWASQQRWQGGQQNWEMEGNWDCMIHRAEPEARGLSSLNGNMRKQRLWSFVGFFCHLHPKDL